MVQRVSTRWTRFEFRRPGLILALNVLLAIGAAVAIGTLVLQYGGFRKDALPVSAATLQLLRRIIVGFFILDRLARLGLVDRRGAYLKDNWLDYTLIVLFVVAMGIAFQYHHNLVSAGMVFVVITQAYLLAAIVLRGISANLVLAGSGLPPAWLLIVSFATLILVGSGLLMLPAAVRPEFQARWFYPEALFTATSATCVTGLVVVDTGTQFTLFGQAVLLVMIQLGGLGIMIFGTMLALLAGKALSLRGREAAMGELLADDRIGELGRVLRFVLVFTFLIEALGAALLLPMFLSPNVFDAWGRAISIGGAVWHSVFHSVSAFCNAGFALYPDSFMQGAGGVWPEAMRSHWQVLGVIAPLIVLGGLGFPVLRDGWDYLRSLPGRSAGNRPVEGDPHPRPRLSLHSKIVLTTTAVLIVVGAAGLAVFAFFPKPSSASAIHGRVGSDDSANDDWAAMSAGETAGAIVFQSITARTAGFNTLDMNELSDAGKVWMCLLMTIGGSPASTAGGIKTVTFALMVLAAWSLLRRRDRIEAFGRSVHDVLLRRAVTLVLLYLGLVLLVTLLLSARMTNETFIDLLFEACSACGTVGLSTGVTNRLGVFEEFVVMAGMYLGRIGPLTLLVAVSTGVRRVEYSYPEESVMIG